MGSAIPLVLKMVAWFGGKQCLASIYRKSSVISDVLDKTLHEEQKCTEKTVSGISLTYKFSHFSHCIKELRGLAKCNTWLHFHRQVQSFFIFCKSYTICRKAISGVALADVFNHFSHPKEHLSNLRKTSVRLHFHR
jgi:hypothetical protein